MRRLLIVDDERSVCERIEGLLPWGDYGIQDIVSVSNGERAMALIRSERVDLVISDIKMPVMDGLELASLVHAEHPRLRMILMSAYNDFAYAQSAIRSGVKGYLLKPVVREELAELVRSVTDEWRQDEAAIAAKPAAGQSAELQLVRLLQGHPQDETSSDEDWPFLLQAEGTLPYLRIVVCTFDSATDFGPMVALQRLFRQSGSRCPLLRSAVALPYGNRLVLFIHSPLSISKQDLLSPLRELGEELRSYDAALPIGTGMIAGVGNLHQGKGAVAASYHEANYALSARFFQGSNTILFRQDLPAVEADPKGPSPIKDRQQPIADELIAAVAGRQPEEARKLVHAYFGLLPEGSPLLIADIRLGCMEIVFALDRSMQERNAGDKFPDKSEVLGTIQRSDTLAQLKVWFARTMVSVAERAEPLSDSGNRYVQLAKRYVAANYRDKMMVEDVADHLHLNTKYFSSLFKRETGESFIDYVNRVRIETAAERILKSDAKIYEICSEVGFHNFSYFNKLFKKLVGVTPLTYRIKRTSYGG